MSRADRLALRVIDILSCSVILGVCLIFIVGALMGVR